MTSEEIECIISQELQSEESGKKMCIKTNKQNKLNTSAIPENGKIFYNSISVRCEPLIPLLPWQVVKEIIKKERKKAATSSFNPNGSSS